MADGALFRIQDPRRGLPACLRTVVLFAQLRHRQCERGGPDRGLIERMRELGRGCRALYSSVS